MNPDPVLAAAADLLDPAGAVTHPGEWARTRLNGTPWSKQDAVLDSVWKHRRTAVPACFDVGKALAVDTPIPTPDGWTTMGALDVGDMVLSPSGQPTRVVRTTPATVRPAARVTFGDGTSITASLDHQWTVLPWKDRHRLTQAARTAGARVTDWRGCWADASTVTTVDLAAALTVPAGRNWLIPATRAYDGAAARLPLDPYLYGLWLGDGTTVRAEVTAALADAQVYAAALASRGIDAQVIPTKAAPHLARLVWGRLTVDCPARVLGTDGKNVAAAYLRAPAPDRLDLLRGLMDTDGFLSTGASVGLDLCHRGLADAAAELVRSLGWVARRTTKATPQGRTVYRLQFRPGACPFALPRKAARWRAAAANQAQASAKTAVAVTDVDPVPDQPVRCITVEAPDGLFLAGPGWTPTHNSWSAAVLAAWWIDQHPPGSAFVVTTAPTASQVRAILWREIRKAHRAGRLPGRVNQTEWWLALDGQHRSTPRWDEQMVGMGRKPGQYDAAAFQGIHARFVMVIIDEAAGVPPELWDAAEGLLANKDCRVLAIGNPETADSRFADVCAPGSGWNTVHISAFDSPNFTPEGNTLPASVLASLVSPTWVEERRLDWGEGDPRWDSKVLGKFPVIGERQLLQTDWVAAAVERGKAAGPDARQGRPVLGVDVARFGSARSVVAARWGRHVTVLDDWGQARTTETTGKVLNLMGEHQAAAAHVDGVGVGGGVVDGLEEAGANVIDMQAGAAASDPTRYVNARSEWYWNLRTLLQNDEVDLPAHQHLYRQAVAMRWAVDSRGRIRVETKDEMAKRGVPSPDHLDAVVLALAEPVLSAPVLAMPGGDTQANEWR